MNDILVVGGGAAGMMAALQAGRAGARVTLLEHNEKLGKKIYITGKGRCNVTNNCTQEEFLQQVPRNPRFLYSALSAFSPQDLMTLLQGAGCPLVVERGRRVFPLSQKASDITRTLTHLMADYGVKVMLNADVTEILTRDGHFDALRLAGGQLLHADGVILATGGKSYPSTGSHGAGYAFAQSLGHTVLPARPVLTGLETRETWPQDLQGLSLKNVTLTLQKGKKKLYQELGELLFTHFGVSGPLVLEASCHLPDELAPDVSLQLDLKPALTVEQLDSRLRREFEAAGKKQLRNILPGLLPGKLAELFPLLCGLPEDLCCNQITAPQRESLLAHLKCLRLTPTGPRSLEEAIVTRGGVSVKEINPATMESKIVSGVYFAGELIDVDAHTGGYNLQIAFSTGTLAGRAAAQERE